MKARNSGTDIQFDPAPAAMHIARCIRVVDLGTTFDEFWGKEKHECWVMWELPNEMHTYTIKQENGTEKEITEPFTVSKFYTLSLSEKAHLRNDLESWRGRGFTEEELEGFEMKKILGAPSMVNVIHAPKKAPRKGINVIVKTVTGLPDGLQCPPAINDLVYFSLDPEEFNAASLEKLTKGIKQRVMHSNEYIAITTGIPAGAPTQQELAEPAGGDDFFDDIPF